MNEKIIENEGLEELRNIIETWERLSANIREKSFDEPIIVPDMIWLTPNGAGKTVLLEYLSEELQKLGNIADFYGDVPFFEFYLEYCSPETDFHELSRLIEEVNVAAGFRDEYRGIIHVDVSEWIGKTEEKHFKTMLEYVSDNSDNWLVVFSMPNNESEQIHNAVAMISSYMRVEVVYLQLPTTPVFVDKICVYLKKYGIETDDSAKELLARSVDKLRENKYFDGYKTVSILCKDIVYQLFSDSDAKTRTITSADLEVFGPDSNYTKKMIHNGQNRNRNKIGF